MPAGLAALRDDKVDAEVRRARRLGRAGDGPEHDGARVLRPARVGGRVPLPERDHAATGVERRLEPARLVRDERQIDAEALAPARRRDVAGQDLAHLGLRHVEADEAHRTFAGQRGQELGRRAAAKRGREHRHAETQAVGERGPERHRGEPPDLGCPGRHGPVGITLGY